MAFEWLKKAGQGFLGESEYSPEAKEIDTTRGDEERALGLESRGQQQQLGDFYNKAVQGQGPSVAQQQLAQGARMGMAAAAAGRGTNQALAQRNAADIVQQTNNQSAQLRAQEQMGYAKQYSDLLQAQRMQDLLARGYSVDEAKAQLNYYGQLQAAKLQSASDEAARKQKAIGGVVTAVGSIAGGISDEQAKEAIQPVGMGFQPGPARETMIGGAGPSVRPDPARSSMIPTPPVRTVGGGMQPLQMNNPQGDWYGQGNFSPETSSGPGPQAPGGPTVGQSIGNALMGLGGGAAGNYQPLIDAMKAQQEQQKQTMQAPDEVKPNDNSGGGIGGALTGLGMNLSDKDSKTAIRDLHAENRSLKQAFMNMAGGGFLAGGIPGAVAVPLAANAAAQPSTPQLQPGALSALASGVKRASGSAAYSRLAPAERRDIATALMEVPNERQDLQGRDLRSEAARDYALRLQNFRQAEIDAQRDADALTQAAMAPGLKNRLVAEEDQKKRTDTRRKGEAAQASLYGELVNTLRK